MAKFIPSEQPECCKECPYCYFDEEFGAFKCTHPDSDAEEHIDWRIDVSEEFPDWCPLDDA